MWLQEFHCENTKLHNVQATDESIRGRIQTLLYSSHCPDICDRIYSQIYSGGSSRDIDRWERVTCVFSGGVRQVESVSAVVGPAHELDSHLVAGWLDEVFDLQTQTAVLHCETAEANKTQELQDKEPVQHIFYNRKTRSILDYEI